MNSLRSNIGNKKEIIIQNKIIEDKNVDFAKNIEIKQVR